MDPLALWGAITGTAGAGIALRREYLAGRRCLSIAPGINFTTSRVEPIGSILNGWAVVALWNTGGRDLAVERAGFQYLAVEKDTENLRVMRAMIHIGTARETLVDGPTHKIYTPLGPMLASGIDPFDIIEAVVVTTGGREWLSPPQPLIQSMPPNVAPDLFRAGLKELRDKAEAPPVLGNEVGLLEEEPYLIDGPPSAKCE
jgi:hypothetical protein